MAYFPAGQVIQLLEFDSGWYFPGGQRLHGKPHCLEGLYRPAVHAMHDVAADFPVNDPAGHVKQVDAPEFGWKRPDSQGVHFASDERS